MSGPNSYSNPPPPPGQTATWMPPTGPTVPPAPAVPMSQRLAPENIGAKVPWAFLAFLAQSIGLLLIFVGGLIAVTAGVVPPSCFSSATACGSGTASNIAYGVMAARLLLVLGLFGLATGAGLHLQFRPPLASGATPEETRVYLARRRGEFLLLVISLVLLFALVWWSAYVSVLPT
jgi:hypothetical protein